MSSCWENTKLLEPFLDKDPGFDVRARLQPLDKQPSSPCARCRACPVRRVHLSGASPVPTKGRVLGTQVPAAGLSRSRRLVPGHSTRKRPGPSHCCTRPGDLGVPYQLTGPLCSSSCRSGLVLSWLQCPACRVGSQKSMLRPLVFCSGSDGHHQLDKRCIYPWPPCLVAVLQFDCTLPASLENRNPSFVSVCRPRRGRLQAHQVPFMSRSGFVDHWYMTPPIKIW